jgi:hypothetical protein
MAEAQSVTTFVVGARLPWPDESALADDKGPFEEGVIHDSGFRQTCSIRKISPLGATIRTRVLPAPGEAIVVELPNGQRATARVDWVKDGESGILFCKTVDVLALINRTLVSQPAERRAMPRVEIRCGAYLKRGEDFLPATIRNISAAGLQLVGASLPPVGSYVSLFIEGLKVPPGEVAWRKDNLAGVELLEELSWTSIMPWIRGLVRSQAQ